MKYLFDFIFCDGTKEIVLCDSEKDINYNEHVYFRNKITEKLLLSDFIRGIMECESDKIDLYGTQVIAYGNIKINFTRDEFSGYLQGTRDEKLFKINLFFGPSDNIAECIAGNILQKIMNDPPKIVDTLRKDPSLYHAIASKNYRMPMYITKHITYFANNFYQRKYFEIGINIGLLQKKYGRCNDIYIIHQKYTNVIYVTYINNNTWCSYEALASDTTETNVVYDITFDSDSANKIIISRSRDGLVHLICNDDWYMQEMPIYESKGKTEKQKITSKSNIDHLEECSNAFYKDGNAELYALKKREYPRVIDIVPSGQKKVKFCIYSGCYIMVKTK